MPKQKKITKKLRAQNLSRPYIKAGFNQAKVARQRGVTRQTIQEQVHKPAVRDILQNYLDSPTLDRRLKAVAEDGLKAKKFVGVFGKRKEKDHAIRFRFWNGLMQAKGKIKPNGAAAGISVLTIVYGYRKNPSVETKVIEAHGTSSR